MREPVLTVSPSTYVFTYDHNAEAADQAYNGAILAITGEVACVRTSANYVRVDLGVPSDPVGILRVQCVLRNMKDAIRLTVGSTVTLIGKGDGKSAVPRLIDCIVR